MVERRMGIATAVALAGMLAGCGTQGASPSSATTGARELIVEGPMFAAASRYGDLVFTAGTLPSDTGAGIDDQVESALDNLEAALEAAGAGFDSLLKVNVYLTDWDNWDRFNSMYVDRIGEHGLPPRATVELVGLSDDSLIEIEAIAHVRNTSP